MRCVVDLGTNVDTWNIVIVETVPGLGYKRKGQCVQRTWPFDGWCAPEVVVA